MAVDGTKIEEVREYNINPPESVYKEGLYLLSKRWKKGNLKQGDLDPKLSFDVISSVMTSAQKICFKDDKIGENKDRIMEILNTKCDENPTIVVGFSINKDEEAELPNFNDAASLTIQRMPLNVLLETDDTRNSYWINEVCRSAVDLSKIPFYLDVSGKPKYFSPVPTLMGMAIQYVRDLGESKVYLFVEKKTDNNHVGLLNYYNKKYGFEIIEDAEDNIYMAKNLFVGGKRKTRKNRKKSRKNRKKINKKSRKNRK